jgi:2-dehydro-3-deoxyphosphogluconate aldolase/(4S)-4-hydroxy-2-oxoglutarate aldolase
MVKIFPAETLGPAYVRALKGPFPDIKLLPTGGVDLKTLAEFTKAGASGFGVGNPLFNRERIAAADWTWVEEQCRAFADAYSTLKNSANS